VLWLGGGARAAFNACDFVNSTATAPEYNGEPAYVARWGGVAHVVDCGRLIMQSCVLRDNTAALGASVWAGGSSEVRGSQPLVCCRVTANRTPFHNRVLDSKAEFAMPVQ
jgi:hypothetical protein